MGSHLYYKDIVGATQDGRACLVMKKHTFFNEASLFVKKNMESNDIRISQEEIHEAKVAGFAQQETWMKWESV